MERQKYSATVSEGVKERKKMITIYKYNLMITGHQQIQLPIGADVLSAKEQNGNLCIWAMVDTDKSDIMLDVYIQGTGQPSTLPERHQIRFIDSVEMSNGLVWHIYVACK